MLYNHFYFFLINQEPEHNFGDHQKLVSISKQHCDRKLADKWKDAEETWNMNMKMLTTMMISKATMTKMTKTKRGRDKKQGARRWKWRKPCHRLLPSPSNKHKAPSTKHHDHDNNDNRWQPKYERPCHRLLPSPSTKHSPNRQAFDKASLWKYLRDTCSKAFKRFAFLGHYLAYMTFVKKYCDHSFWGKKTPKRVFWNKTYEKHLFFYALLFICSHVLSWIRKNNKVGA